MPTGNARGKAGTISRDHGVFAFADTSAYGLGDKPQHLYSVRFASRELWGEQASAQDAVYLDLYEDYLEPAGFRSACRTALPSSRFCIRCKSLPSEGIPLGRNGGPRSVRALNIQKIFV
jgi:hypothetical protein